MKNLHRLFIALALTCAVWPLVAGEDFKLQDYLNRSWRNECVTFPLSDEQLRRAKAGHALTGPNGTAVPYQVVEGTPPRIAFLTDLSPLEVRAFQFSDAAAQPVSALKIEDTADGLILSNEKVGIHLRKKLADGKGPLQGVRLNSGAWVGDSTLESEPAVSAYTVEVTARGPVYVEALCKATFAKDESWTVRFRVYSSEPVVLVDEEFNVTGKSSFVVNLGHNFTPDTLLYRQGRQPCRNTTWPLANGEVYVLEPWLHWWERDRQGQCLSLYKADGAVPDVLGETKETPIDLLSVAARDAGAWIDPAIPHEQRARAQITITKAGGAINMPLPLKKGVRKWMFSALNARECLTPFKAEKNIPGLALPDEYMVKHGQFPLNTYKDYVLRWQSETTYPRLFVTKENLPTLRQKIPNMEAYASRAKDFRQGKFSQYALDGQITPTAVYFATGDEEVGRNLAQNAIDAMQQAVDTYLHQKIMPLGAAPHVQNGIATYLAMADGGLAYEKIDPAVRERLLAQAAFLGYVLASPGFWSPARGYSANPNMTTAVNSYKLMVACLIPSHPDAKTWANDALTELLHQMNNWSDDNGGWLEAPHYAAVAFDQLIASLVMAKNAGFNDSLYNPRLKKITEWFAKISTPPDSRLGGYRHLPPIGNSYLQEPTGIFGTMANLWTERDPEFAAQMQWMFEQQRSWPHSAIGGGYPGMVGCNNLFRGTALKPKPPTYGSELFPKTGVILRDVFPSDRETQLHLIAGSNHEHYDYDSGSITIWGKGRIIADDFGYYGRAPANDHSMVIAPGVGNGITHVKAFSTSAALDYVQGVQHTWTRQIAFVKSAEPEGSSYFVINDSLAQPVQYSWLLWLTARNVTLDKESDDLLKTPPATAPSIGSDGTEMDTRFNTPSEARRALMIGREDVDMDVFFLSPGGYTVRTEKKTRTSLAGLDAKGRQSQMPSTQIGLIAESKQGTGVATLLYPRLKTQPAPEVTILAEGRGVKLKTAAGTDYVFLSKTPMTFTEGDVSFSGTVGAIQIRGDKAVLSLGAEGKIAARGQQVTK